MLHHFDAGDILNFLNPKFFYVGASYDRHECQLGRFFRDGIWENGFVKWIEEDPSRRTSTTDLYERYMQKIEKGDILLVKRLNGQGSQNMRVLAIGIALGKNLDKTVRVAWVIQDLNIEMPLQCVGTISTFYNFNSCDIGHTLPDVLKNWVTKAQSKFLRLNLRIEDRYYT